MLQYFGHAEGYVAYDDGNFKYIYQYKDHLGNVRVSYAKGDAGLVIVAENNYYAFGLEHKGYGLPVNPAAGSPKAQQLRYNGKELQEDLQLNWYDYGARNYDAAIGRWMSIDPLAETSRRWSPYSYCYNNPVIFTDPDGMEATPMIDIGYGRMVQANLASISMTFSGTPTEVEQSPPAEDTGNIVEFLNDMLEAMTGSEIVYVTVTPPESAAWASTIVMKKSDGTYVVTGGTPDNDTGVYLDNGSGGKGQLIGYSLTSRSFLYDNGKAVEGAIIDPNSVEGQSFINFIKKLDPSLISYMSNATGRGKYDFKNKGIESRDREKAFLYRYRGSVTSDGKFISARDVGNFVAGMIAGRKGYSWSWSRAAFDTLETFQKVTTVNVGRPIPIFTPAFECPTTVFAQFLGYLYGKKL